MKVIEGLKIGNDCLNKMHQVRVGRSAERTVASEEAESWVFVTVFMQTWLMQGFLALFFRLCQ